MNRRWLHHLRCAPRGRLSDEDGIALIAVMGVMGVLLLVVAWVASGATHVNETTNTDRDSKRALAAAEAGLAVATERLNRTSLLPGQCLTNAGASADGTGECTAPTTGEAESLGNNTSQRFLVSREVGGTTGCTTGHVPAGYERCITAVGRANGVERRLLRPIQTRAPIFGEAGVIGLNGLRFVNSVELGQSVPMTFGTNGQVTMGNSIKARGTFSLPASAPAISVCSGCGSGWTRTTRAEEWELPALDPALDRAWALNQNATLPSSLYNSTTKRFSLSGTATINGGTYVFCELDVRDNGKLRISSGQTAKIYVDSPLRAGSPCPAPTSDKRGRGRLTVDDSAELNLGGTASGLQFYVAGTGDEANNPYYSCADGPYRDDVVLCNSVKLSATFFAPRSTVYLVNSIEVGQGAVAAANVVFGNSIKIGLSGSAGNVTIDVLENRQWYECKAVPSTPSDPESGCTAP